MTMLLPFAQGSRSPDVSNANQCSAVQMRGIITLQFILVFRRLVPFRLVKEPLTFLCFVLATAHNSPEGSFTLLSFPVQPFRQGIGARVRVQADYCRPGLGR